jgi:hypothetical protein
MGSIAMDRAGNLALGYSVSSSGMHPAIRFAGRLAGDSLNSLQAENSIFAGSGSQTKSLDRWGDYTSLSVDPVDDCTFWYTNQYIPSDGSFNWSTRIASFKFPSCAAVPPSVYIDSPASGATLSGIVPITGWAIDNTSSIGTAIGSVDVYLDGVRLGSATYGQSRPDVCAVYPGRPGCPNVGYIYQLNTAAISPGPHTIAVSATDTDSTPDTGSASVTITVASAPPSIYIDSPASGSTVNGTIVITGWAIDNTSAIGTAISNVQVRVDGVFVGNAQYGINRADVCSVYPGRPGCPNVGYSFSLNTSTLSNSTHTITISATDSDAPPNTGSASISLNVSN